MKLSVLMNANSSSNFSWSFNFTAPWLMIFKRKCKERKQV